MVIISLRPIIVRLSLLFFLAAGLGLLGWLIGRAAIGDSYITYVQRSAVITTEGKIEGADIAIKYSPHDPAVLWRRGGVYYNAANEDMTDERLAVAVADLRRAVRMNPEDYRIWLSLGRVLDRSGENAEARVALERAVELAPSHFDPRWAMGNHLLRAGDREAAFAQMRLALANRPSALSLIFDYAWAVYQGDGKAIAAALSPPAEVKARMISLLISHGDVDDGLSIWREIQSPGLKDVQRVTASLANAGHYAAAYDIWSNADIPDRPVPDQYSLLANSSFEKRFPADSKTLFYSWRINPPDGVRVSLDRKDQVAGDQSLRIGFDVEDNVPLILAYQTVPSKPNTRYCLSFSLKTEELESLSTPLVEIFDSADITHARAATSPFPTRDNPWTEYIISLDTTATTEAVTVRLVRPPCSEPPCPITGRIWLDDFKLVECKGIPMPEKPVQPEKLDTEKHLTLAN
ncbi:MAG: tetratricopeptide repeat protein [Blastocatellia bacterium]|nr:tetratricopeptide repeat protein [Blastocatellia bacterium]